MSEKVKFPLYLEPKVKDELERIYRLDGSPSQTEFVNRALKFYIEYLKTQDMNEFLPTAIKSSIDGRLGIFEDRISSLLFKLAVENDMAMNMILDLTNLDEDYLEDRRYESMKNIKRTNGRLSFRDKLMESSDDEWQD